MRIKRIVLKNFGPHALLDWECDAGVIGVTGQNGKGKSHILTAVEFITTGDLADPRATYIKHGEKESYVEAWFTQDGKEGRVKRWLSSSKRELEWDGQTYTAAAQVDEMFGQILGASKETFKNASFIRQGDLKGVLDGAPTVRRQIMTRLLSLGFVDKRKSELDTQIKLYAGNNLDESVYVRADQQQEQIDQLQKNLLLIEQEINQRQVYTDDVLALDKQLQALQNLEQARTQLSLLLTQQAQNFNLEQVNQYKPVSEKTDAVEHQHDKLLEKFRALADTRARQARAVNLQEELIRTDKNIQDQEGLLKLHLNAFTQLTGQEYTAIQSHSLIAQREKEIQTHRAYTASANILQQQRQLLQEKTTELEGITQEEVQQLQANADTDSKELERVQADLTLARLGFNSLEQAVKARESGSISCSGDKLTCPKCNLNVLPADLITPEALEQARATKISFEQSFTDISAKANVSKLQAQTKGLKRLQLVDALKSLQTAVHQQEQTLEKMGVEAATTAAKSIELLESELAKLRTTCSCIAQQEASIQTLQKSRAQTQSALDECGANLTVDVSAEFEAIEKQLNEVAAELKELKTKRDTLKSLYNQFQTMSEQVRGLQAVRIPELESAVEAFTLSTNIVALIEQSNTNCLNTIYKLMVQAEAERLEKLTERRVAQQHLVEALQRLKELDQAKAKQDKYKRVLDRLQELRKMLEPDGVVKAYLTYRFRGLTNRISQYLNLLDANFVIRPHVEDLNFEFQRTDLGDETWQAVQKLSGGQKVKLSCAFLIAVQETICAETNFLTLDEPSTHLDESSVTALGELLHKLGTTMADANGQYWIVDHHYSLGSVFDKNFQL